MDFDGMRRINDDFERNEWKLLRARMKQPIARVEEPVVAVEEPVIREIDAGHNEPNKTALVLKEGDTEIICESCGTPFIFEKGEREFHQSKGWDNLPIRCKKCRAAKKVFEPLKHSK